MAEDLTFTRHIPGVANTPKTPVLQKQVKAEGGHGTPEFQKAFEAYAESENFMSAIGAKVAETASNSLAQHLGAEAGKNPKGTLFPSLTDFDKNFEKSYTTQAHSTLGLQADKLITEANLKASQSPRMSAELIATTQENISKGLQKIYSEAPMSIRPQLEATYGAAQLSQKEQLNKRMLSEQHEDRRNRTILSNDKNAELAHSLAASGQFKAAEGLVKTTQALNDSAIGGNIGFTPQQGKVGTDSVRQAYINGRLQYEYQKAESEKKGDEYLKNLANRPEWISDKDYPAATQSLRSYVSNQQALKSNYEELTMTDFKSRIALNATNIPGTELQSVLDKLSPLNASKLNLYYENALRVQERQGLNQTNLSEHWGDPTAHANSDEKTKNATFNSKVDYTMQNNPRMSRAEAEVHAAMSAGGRIPVFEKSLENKLLSANPVHIDEGSHQIELLNHLEAGRAYSGISQKAKAIAVQFQQQRGSMPDSDLARQITDNLSNIDDKMQKTLDNAWNLKLSTKGAGGLGATKSFSDFALNEVHLDKQKLGGTYFATIYGNEIYDQLNSNFITTRGDYQAALKMTQDYVDQNYHETYINGSKQISDSSIERYLGHKGGNQITPYVQQDLLNQLSVSFAKSNKNHPDDKWETLPLKGKVAEVVRTINTKNGKKQFRYPLNLVGRAGNQWDVVVQTPYALHNLFLVAPHVGVTSYEPDKEAIEKNLLAKKHKGFF